MPLTTREKVQGSATVTEAAQNSTVIAAQGAGTRLRIRKAMLTVTLAATGAGGGLVKLEDGSGGEALFTADADAVGFFPIDFGEDGFDLTANTVLNLTVDSAATNEATAFCTAIGEIIK